MITNIGCWAEVGCATASLHLEYSLAPGEQRPSFRHLAVYFYGEGPFIDAEEFDDRVVNVKIPEFVSVYPGFADRWLRNYVRVLDKHVRKNGAPLPRKKPTCGPGN